MEGNDTFNPNTLTWNIHHKIYWGTKKEILISKMQKLEYIKPVEGHFPLPVGVASDIFHYMKEAKLPKVNEVAFNVDKPTDALYSLKIQYSDGVAVIYLHSDMRRITAIATRFIKKIEVVTPKLST